MHIKRKILLQRRPRKKREYQISKVLSRFLKMNDYTNPLDFAFCSFAFYLLIAFTSYLFTWKVDYNIIDGKAFSFVFSDDSIQITNWLGKLGAYSAHKFLKVWFGISSYIFPFVFFILGVRILFKVSLLPIIKTLKISLVVLVWLSICMGYFFESPYDFMGGLYGAKIISWTTNIAGSIGAAAFVLFTGFLSFIVLFNPSFNWVNSLLVSVKDDNPDFIPEEELEAKNTIKEEDIIRRRTC